MKRRDFVKVAALLFLCLTIGGGGPHAPLNVAMLEAVAVLVLLDTALFSRLSAIGRGGASGLLFAGLFLVVGLCQLIPLPVAWWQAMPGHTVLLDAMKLSGSGVRPWGISLMPDDTRSTLLTFLPPIAVFATVLSMDWRDRTRLVWVVIGVAVASSLLGLAQVASGYDGTLNPYHLEPYGLSVGFFANKNQQAVFMAACFILGVGFWLEATRKDRSVSFVWILAFLALVSACDLGSDSRSGVALLVLAAVAGVGMWQRREIRRHGGFSSWFSALRRRRWLILAGAVLLLVPIVFASSSYQFDRMLDRFEGTGGDARIAFWPDVLYVMKLYFPFGAGFGTFNRVFQLSEPLQSLHDWRVNHAHNDYIELVIECGVAGIALLLGFGVWLILRFRDTWRVSMEDAGGSLMRAAALVILFIMLHSLVEYPLRTEALASLFAMSCAFLTVPAEQPRGVIVRERRRVRTRESRSSEAAS